MAIDIDRLDRSIANCSLSRLVKGFVLIKHVENLDLRISGKTY